MTDRKNCMTFNLSINKTKAKSEAKMNEYSVYVLACIQNVSFVEHVKEESTDYQ